MLTDIEHIGIQNALSNIRQTRESLAMVFLGLMMGIIASMFGQIFLGYLLKPLRFLFQGIDWLVDISLLAMLFYILFISYKAVKQIISDDLRDYRILENLLKLVEQDAKNKNNNLIIPEKVEKAMSGYKNKILSRSEIIKIVKKFYPEINESSLLPSDYCNNKKNEDPASGKHHVFCYLGYNKYRVL